MRIKETSLNGVFLITPHIIKDMRGYFFESFKSKLFNRSSIPIKFAQENQSLSKKGTLRGLHYQLNFPQGKLISVAVGRVIDFVVDIRKGSPTFGKSESFICRPFVDSVHWTHLKMHSREKWAILVIIVFLMILAK